LQHLDNSNIIIHIDSNSLDSVYFAVTMVLPLWEFIWWK